MQIGAVSYRCLLTRCHRHPTPMSRPRLIHPKPRDEISRRSKIDTAIADSLQTTAAGQRHGCLPGLWQSHASQPLWGWITLQITQSHHAIQPWCAAKQSLHKDTISPLSYHPPRKLMMLGSKMPRGGERWSLRLWTLPSHATFLPSYLPTPFLRHPISTMWI